MLTATKLSSAMLCLWLLSGCALTSKAPNFNGLHDVDGSEAPVHINLTKIAVHLGIVMPLIGDASLDGAVEEFTNAAKQVGQTESGSFNPMRPRSGGFFRPSPSSSPQSLRM